MKKVWIILGLALLIGIWGKLDPIPTQKIAGSSIAVPTATPTPTVAIPTATPTLIPTSTPTPTPKVVYKPPTPTVYSAPTTQSTGLSNDSYYTNSDGTAVHSPAYSNSVPAGATAICGDGTYSFSLHRSGTCSHHDGVAQWL